MIYLDNAATTRVKPEVRAAMDPFLDRDYGNASSLHAAGRRARRALEDARESKHRASVQNPGRRIPNDLAHRGEALRVQGVGLKPPKQRPVRGPGIRRDAPAPRSAVCSTHAPAGCAHRVGAYRCGRKGAPQSFQTNPAKSHALT